MLRLDPSATAYIQIDSATALHLLSAELERRDQVREEKHRVNIEKIMQRGKWFEGWFGIKPYTFEEARKRYENEAFLGSDHAIIEMRAAYLNYPLNKALLAAKFAVANKQPTIFVNDEVAQALERMK